MKNSTTESAPPPAAAELPPAEELLKKIHELELGHARLKQEMSKLLTSSTSHIMAVDRHKKQRSHSISPQRAPRWRADVRDCSAGAAWKRGSTSFRHSSPLQRESRDGGGGGGGVGPSAVKFTDKQYLNILQSMGQSVHILDMNNKIIYWNRMAENLYGYSAAEALGMDVIELLVDPRDAAMADEILQRVLMGESWTGQFPVKNKRGERFSIVATNTPFYDDDGTLVGGICTSTDSRPFQEAKSIISVRKDYENDSSLNRPRSIASAKLGLDPQKPLQVAIASKISDLASKVSNKVKSKMRPQENFSDHEGGSWDGHHSDHVLSDVDHREDAASSGASSPRGELPPCAFGVFSGGSQKENSPGKPSRDSGDEVDGKHAIARILSSKAETWIGKKGLGWPWKGNERDATDPKTPRFVWPWIHNDQENEFGQQQNAAATFKSETEANRTANNEASWSWSSSFNVNSTSSASSCGSTSSGVVNKVDTDIDSLDCEILWEDLTIGEQIGQG